jgi:hypothetical protein
MWEMIRSDVHTGKIATENASVKELSVNFRSVGHPKFPVYLDLDE